MKNPLPILILVVAIACLGLHAEHPSPRPLLSIPTSDSEKQLKPSSAQVSVTRDNSAPTPALKMIVQPGSDKYPGVTLKPAPEPAWDLSAFGYVETRLTNTGTIPTKVALRIDNDDDWQKSPMSADGIQLPAGASGVLRVYFGYFYGKPAYPLKSAAITKLLLFVSPGTEPQSIRIESIEASGSVGEKPHSHSSVISVKPANGILFGNGTAFDPGKQIGTVAGAQATPSSTPDAALQLQFPAASPNASVTIKPTEGCWDLRDSLEVRVTLRNAGEQPVTPRAYLTSPSGNSDTITDSTPLAPGATQELVLPFISSKIWNGEKGSGNQLRNDAVSGVVVSTLPTSNPRSLIIDSIRASVPAPAPLPEWLGKRPPVDGDWVQTFNDDFNGTELDLTKWNNTGPNYWDKVSRWSPFNVIVRDGVARMRYEKKTGLQNDDPKGKQSDYTGGYLDTYGKWTQRYGYFETRIKLPTAPGLWPAFWLMPDRGVAAKDQPTRQDTGNGGMEFDIFEHLTRWGAYRTNIAMHFDGYGPGHKSVGSERIYFQPDKDGFITTGLLWTPGLAVYYINGREVLRYESPRVSNVTSDMMFTVPAGGWDNAPIDDAKLPDDLIIDYVRVWQRKDLTSPGDGPQKQP